MSVAKQAEEYVKRYFSEKRGIDLLPRRHPDRGFDFRDKDSTLFVEVKGTATRDLAKVLFRYFSNSEYEMAKRCILEKKQYEVHIVLAIGTEVLEHYIVPARDFVAGAKPEVVWYLPVRKDFRRYRADSTATPESI